jgi:guanine deaminase
MPGAHHSSWIIRGNVVVPTRNPFQQGVDDDPIADAFTASSDEDHHVIVLGPGLILLVDHILQVQDGFITCLMPAQRYLAERGPSPLDAGLRLHLHYVELDSAREFLVPGMIDLHIHAPQYSYAGTATDRPLMGPDGWLETYTFPAEARLGSDLRAAQRVYRQVVRSTLAHGTTTALYFATLHLEPTKVLADAAMEHGQRALVGKVCMDRNAPGHYLHTTTQNVQDTEHFIRYVRGLAGDASSILLRDIMEEEADPPRPRKLLPRVLPVITPRFIPTCTPELLTALGELAARYDCHVTTHASESVDEVEFTRHLDATADGGDGTRSDSAILDHHRLLTSKCVLAHGVHLSEDDMDLLRDRQCAVAHCPLSNLFFAGGTLPARTFLERGNRVGLGTDVAGGYSPSMWNSCRMAVVASHALQHQHQHQPSNVVTSSNTASDAVQEQHHVLDYRHALYLATLGGAQALGLDHRIGTFRVGMEFDAVVLSAVGSIGGDGSTAASSSGPIDVFETDTLSDVFQKLCVLGDDRNVRRVFVQGRDVTVARR